MSKVVCRADSEAAAMASLYDEYAAVLWRYAIGLTGDASSAEDVVRETLPRAWQHPEAAGGAERSARASLFAIARDLVIDERGNDSSRPRPYALEEVGSALDRSAIANAMARLSAESGRDRTLLLQGMAHRTGRHRPRNRRRNSEVPTTLCRSGAPTTHSPRDGGRTLTALRSIGTSAAED